MSSKTLCESVQSPNPSVESAIRHHSCGLWLTARTRSTTEIEVIDFPDRGYSGPIIAVETSKEPVDIAVILCDCTIYPVQYTFDFILFCFSVVVLSVLNGFMWSNYPYNSGLLPWHWEKSVISFEGYRQNLSLQHNNKIGQRRIERINRAMNGDHTAHLFVPILHVTAVSIPCAVENNYKPLVL